MTTGRAGGIAPEASLRMNLSQDEDELRAGLTTSLQRWTRRWPARGVRVRRGTQDDVAAPKLLRRGHWKAIRSAKANDGTTSAVSVTERFRFSKASAPIRPH